MEWVVRHLHRLPRALVESPFLQGLKNCGCGTWGHGFVLGLAVQGEKLDKVISKAVSNLNDSVNTGFGLDKLLTIVREGCELM